MKLNNLQQNMFVVHKIADQLVILPEQSQDIEKNIVHRVFQKYLFKFSELGYCVSVINVDFLSNVIMRETANIMVQILVEAMFIELKEDDYVEGIVTSMNDKRIKIQLFGCLQASIQEEDLHEGSTFEDEKKSWILATTQSSGYLWEIGDKVRAKILRLRITKGPVEMQQIIRLRSNQAGLGPAKWWI